MSGPAITGQCDRCRGWASSCNCAALPPVWVKAVVGPATCPFCDFDDCYLSERDECIVCPACGAKGPTDWKRFGDTELIPLEMWERRANVPVRRAASASPPVAVGGKVDR